MGEASEYRADGDQPVTSGDGTGKDGARHPGKSDSVLRQGTEVKYAFIRRHRQVWPIRIQFFCCRVIVSKTGFA